MAKLIPIEYHGKKYPQSIRCEIKEVSANFDAPQPVLSGRYSLYTDHSFASRKMNTACLAGLTAITTAHRKSVPQLWTGKDWAEEFAEFIRRLVGSAPPPEIIEIHPPYNDYCPDMHQFLELYCGFEEEMVRSYPDVKILLENRCGTFYTGGRFLVSKVKDMLLFLDSIKDLRLGLMLDIPQLFSVHFHDMPEFRIGKAEEILTRFTPYRDKIGGLHLWGKKKSEKGFWVSHHGTLDTLFCGIQENKTRFLSALATLLDDGIPRYFIPEVNSDINDLYSILNDVSGAGFTFV